MSEKIESDQIKAENFEKNSISEKRFSTELNDEKEEYNGSEKNIDIDEHLYKPEEIAKRYRVDIDTYKPAESRGLSTKEVEKLMEESGPNVLTPPPKKHPFLKYLECLRNLFNILLMISGAFTLIVLAIDYKNNQSNTYLGAILFGVAFLNAYIQYYQIKKSASILESFLHMIPQKCHVLRESKLLQIEASNLVPGDIVFVKMGDKVPADLFMFTAVDMKVDNSTLTGESEPQERVKTTSTNKNPLEASNLCFSGTIVVSGEGYGIVIRTGDSTVLGQVAGLTTREGKNVSPLAQETNKFVKIITVIATLCAIIFFGASFAIVNNFALNLSFAIAILVAWVPQGLPATVTILLTIAAKRMAAQNVLVKDLEAVETLGAITLLATDKTGTLTRNKMTVAHIWSSLNVYSLHQNAQSENALPFDPNAPGIQEIIHIASLCSRVKFNRTDIPFSEREIFGDATETGLLRFAAQNVNDYDVLVNNYPKIFEIPFNSETKWALTIHKKKHDNGELTLYIKGAPERVLNLCSTILSGKDVILLADEHRKKYDEAYEYMASKGHRVLALAQLLLSSEQYPENFKFEKEKNNYPLGGYCFIGLCSLEDPPKHGVREAIGICREAGIRVIMVTGDHPLTAESIARRTNIMTSDTKSIIAQKSDRPIESIGDNEYHAIVIHGEEIDSLSDEDWDNIFSKQEVIFARTSPRHKLDIVKRAQSMGHIVGVTGDGVNDSPALKKADLGISMNKSGSDVSKEAASMILIDDNFASVVKGIAEGRLIFTNLKKSIQYTLSHITPEVVVSLLYITVPLPLPLSPLLVLITDLGYELFVVLSYAWDQPESKKDLMKIHPRKPVTPKSVERLRLNALNRTPSITDLETGQPVTPSKISLFLRSLKKPFTARWWIKLLKSTEGEVLVDGTILSWAYLEVGIIESIGCIVAYFAVLNYNGITPYDARNMQTLASEKNYFTSNAESYVNVYNQEITKEDQIRAAAEAESIVYLSIMIQQVFNLFACKAQHRLPFGKFMFTNPRNFIGVFLGFTFAICIVYIPPLNIAFLTSHTLNPKFLLIPAGFGVLILIYTCIRVLNLRKWYPKKLNHEKLALDLHETVYTI
ncbi:unnamed protein product [Rhizophagus irregularis]|uniref:P-type cation exchange, alpha subunit of ATPase n=1 Tax=Rhizophagus irregularis TaxID=588596 RepID=A0A2N1NKH3_9GLOM|nr:P-type cation exchange, alpha subunit of ATPase [Rhizophagus irregularis]CAB4389242.1 unnamed protein product [Rhizophagus irregularis]CAB5362132.1 unnamed protein product [Rhizophagus irregularis]